MASELFLPVTAAIFSLVLAAIAVASKAQRGVVRCAFAAGMIAFGLDAVLCALILATREGEALPQLYSFSIAVKACASVAWLSFSVTYSRGDTAKSMRPWRPFLIVAALVSLGGFLVPAEVVVAVIPTVNPTVFFAKFSGIAQVLNALALATTVLALMNLERTFRAAVGTMQWRIKFVVLGLAIMFGARFYTRSQALVYSGQTNSLNQLEVLALLVGCAFLTVAYLRSGLREIDVYPSRAVLYTSFTILLAGAYLFVVGVLAQIVARFGATTPFQLEALVVLIAVALLAVLLLSDRLRQRVRHFVSHHFKRPHYDVRALWTRFTYSTSSAIDDESLCGAAAKLVSETFNVLSVSIWLFHDEKERLALTASTSRARTNSEGDTIDFPGAAKLEHLVDLERVKEGWGESLRSISASQFDKGGSRIAVPLRAGDRFLGVLLLADRVNGVPYTVEERELLECIAEQVASGVLNLRLAEKIMLGKELEAFQTISAFFVHDLKNAASTLNLMLQNLPVHFDDVSFRTDALRGIGETTDRINHIIERLGAVRERLELRPSQVDLNALVREAVESVNGVPGIEVGQELAALPKLTADPDQLRSVVTNLLLNARDAVGAGGHIQVRTDTRNGWARLSISDDGCGMTEEFVRDSLFRPFKTTKKKGLGIGMFQTKMIVEAHQGSIRVRSNVGEGTTFQVLLPLNTPAQ